MEHLNLTSLQVTVRFQKYSRDENNPCHKRQITIKHQRKIFMTRQLFESTKELHFNLTQKHMKRTS